MKTINIIIKIALKIIAWEAMENTPLIAEGKSDT